MRSFVSSVLILTSTAMAVAATVATRTHADEGAQLSVQVDRREITQDDSVSLKFSIQSEGREEIGKPQYSAPDFELVNEYSGTYVESYYVNGSFGVKHNQQFTKILRPQRTGTFTIRDIQVKVGGELLKAPPITVTVQAGGAGTPPPRNYGGGGGGGLRGSGKRLTTLPFFVRAEMDQRKIYKGQQVIVSYYLYQRARTFNLQVDKYPMLSGFLREDLEMPIVQQRLESEPVVLDGTPYQRALLVRYAAYPLKEGKLTIDSMAVKANYYAPRGGMDDEEDPFTQFFQQMAPRASNSQSDPLTLEVLPLPSEGRPADYSGGVGDFNLTAAVDRYEVRANEPVSLTVKVEGRGNLSAIDEPKLDLPAGVEIYESKGQTKAGRGGVGEKIFEFLLIPRTPGQLALPPVRMSFFDPAQAKYVTKTTPPVTLKVMEGAPGSQVAPPPGKSTAPSVSSDSGTSTGGIRPLKTPGTSTSLADLEKRIPWGGILGLGFLLALGALLVQGMSRLRSRKSREIPSAAARIRKNSREWGKLKQNAQLARQGLAFKDVLGSYDRLSMLIYDALDALYPQHGVKGLSRSELHDALVHQQGLPEPVWERACRLFEFTEAVRFASTAGAVSEQSARNELEKWVDEGQLLENEFLNRYK